MSLDQVVAVGVISGEELAIVNLLGEQVGPAGHAKSGQSGHGSGTGLRVICPHYCPANLATAVAPFRR